MSHFEFVTVMISVILALALGQLLNVVSVLAKERRRVIPFVPHTLWLISLALIIINHWWGQWDFRGIDWNYAYFVYALLAPTLLFFAVALLNPGRASGNEINLPQQFFEIRPLFMKIILALGFVVWFDGAILSNQEAFNLIGFVHVPIIAAALLGLFSERLIVHIVAPSITGTILLIVMIYRFLVVPT